MYFGIVMWTIVALPILCIVGLVIKNERTCCRSRRTRQNLRTLDDTLVNGHRFHRRMNSNSDYEKVYEAVYCIKRKEVVRKSLSLVYHDGMTSTTVVTPFRSTPQTKHIEEPICSICLSEFEVGDCLAKSAYPMCSKCDHTYHYDCLSNWLMKHDTCPMCRQDIIHIKTLCSRCNPSKKIKQIRNHSQRNTLDNYQQTTDIEPIAIENSPFDRRNTSHLPSYRFIIDTRNEVENRV